jgi:hypothetical protein
MIALINQKDLLACPATAIALLANEASDAEVLYPTVLEFIKTCTRVPNRDGVDINALPEDQQAARRRAEEQELFALEGGVKEWYGYLSGFRFLIAIISPNSYDF